MRQEGDPEGLEYTTVTVQEPLRGPKGSRVAELLLAPRSPPEKPTEPGPHCYHECTERARKALQRVTRFHAALGLAAVLLIVVAGLSVYIRVLKGSQCSEQPQIKEAQSSAAADGKDGEVLPPCGDDWVWYRNKCFYFSEAEGNWTEVKDMCAALDSSLALIDTQQELDFMLRYKGDRHHWIGLQRETDKQWKWVNGTEFNNWFVVEDYSECAYLNHDRVKSAECYSKRNWICTRESAYEPKRKKRFLIIQHFRWWH